MGTTGECPTLSHPEHERVIAAVVEAAAGRAKVMAGTGSNSTEEALRLTRWAAKRGADAALVVAPYYNKPTQEGFFQHFKALAEAVDIPICVYNIPGRTGKNIEADTIVRMAELPNITMVKEASGSMDAASQILAKTDLTLLSGDDSLTLPLMSLGGRGVVSVVGNIVPKDVIAMIRAFDAGNLARGPVACTSSSSPCAATCSVCRPIRSPSRPPCRCWAATRGDLRMPLTRLPRLTTAEDARTTSSIKLARRRTSPEYWVYCLSLAHSIRTLRPYSLRICHAQRRRAVDALDARTASPGPATRFASPRRPVGPLAEALRNEGVEVVPFEPRDAQGVRLPLDELRRNLADIVEAAPPCPAPRQQPGHGTTIGPRGRGVVAAEPFAPPRHRDP